MSSNGKNEAASTTTNNTKKQLVKHKTFHLSGEGAKFAVMEQNKRLDKIDELDRIRDSPDPQIQQMYTEYLKRKMMIRLKVCSTLKRCIHT